MDVVGKERIPKHTQTCPNGQGGMPAFFCIRFVFFKQFRIKIRAFGYNLETLGGFGAHFRHFGGHWVAIGAHLDPFCQHVGIFDGFCTISVGKSSPKRPLFEHVFGKYCIF